MRELTDTDFDNMHHALGRPAADHRDTYRNYFCCETASPEANRFEETECWDFGRWINDGRACVYHVNGVGQTKLREWLRARAALTEPHRTEAERRPHPYAGRAL